MKYLILALLFISCNEIKGPNAASASADSITAGMSRTKNPGEQVEGRFINIKKLNERTYVLSLQIKDSVNVFQTIMPLNETEIGMLKKEGNNIKLTYRPYYNPATKRTVKLVLYMQPVYENLGR